MTPQMRFMPTNTFHQVWIERSRNRELARLWHGINVKLRRMEAAQANAACSVDEHWPLVAALKQGRWSDVQRALEHN
jgi:DNA-binding GntR family transcriptional regulator